MEAGLDAGPLKALPAHGSPGRLRIAPVDLKLRAREPADDDSLVRLFTQPRCRAGLITPPFENAAEISRRLPIHRPDTLEIVAARRDVAIGYAGVFPGAVSRRHVGEISVFVHDEFHGLGVGALLLKGAIASAEILLRIERIELLVRTTNLPAIALYSRFGFIAEGRHCGYARLDGVDIDVLTMARMRPAAAAK